MITRYHEQSVEVEIHSDVHAECTPEHQAELEEGWQCTCTDCRCESIVKIQAAYAFNEKGDHEVIIRFNPGQYHGAGTITFTADVARAFASALCFAANDADQLNRDFPKD